MTVRHAAALVAAAVALAGSPASAAAPVCRLVVDPPDDAHVAKAGPGRPGIDILSADVATGAFEMVAVVRLASLEPDDLLRAGTRYRFSWEIDSVPQFVELLRYSGGEQVATFDPNASDQSSRDHVVPKVVLDPGTGTIRWTVPRKANTELTGRGLRFEHFAVDAEASVNYLAPSGTRLYSSTTVGAGGDEATSARRYADRARSCVKAR